MSLSSTDRIHLALLVLTFSFFLEVERAPWRLQLDRGFSGYAPAQKRALHDHGSDIYHVRDLLNCY